jgi:REP element-mobilizing transposase RayT
MRRDTGAIPHGEPLAFFLTWTTYGTWLPGDERGWVDKPGDSRRADADLERAARSRMTEPCVTLDDQQRQIVERAIADHCRVRGWHLHAVNCRTNHVHAVVTAHTRNPDDVLDQFKAWCTRRLKDRQHAGSPEGFAIRSNWWTQRGSKRWLNDESSLDVAVQYVREAQDRVEADTQA